MNMKARLETGLGVILIFTCFSCSPKVVKKPKLPCKEIEFSGFILDDSPEGNDDNNLNPGETVNIFILVKNNSQQPIADLRVVASTRDKGLVILDSTATFPVFFPGDVASSRDPIVFTASQAFLKANAELTLRFPPCTESVKARRRSRSRAAAGPIDKDEIIQIPNETKLFVCFDSCRVVPGVSSAIDTLEIRLAMCNESGLQVQDVAAVLPAGSLTACGKPGVVFQEIKSVVFYNTSQNNTCTVPANICPPHVFRYTFNRNDLSGESCIRFAGDFYMDVESDTCVFTDGLQIKHFDLCCHLETP
ncbi:MAG: hypothetical protein ACE5IY_19315 [bacterium]